MQLLKGSGARIYRISTVLAFVTGLMAFVPIVAAAIFAGAATSLIGCIFLLVTGAWMVCNLIAIIFLGSRKSFPSGCAIAGSSAVSLLCGYGLILLASNQQVNDPLYFTAPISARAWEAIPFVSNTIQVVLSILRYQQLRTSEVTPCPQ
jgi:hypothetical protein